MDNGSAAYALLNACRARVYADDDRLVSKVAVGRALLERGLGPPQPIRTAPRVQGGLANPSAQPSDPAVVAFIHRTIDLGRRISGWLVGSSPDV